MQYINLILAAAYPKSFRTNRVFENLKEAIERRVRADDNYRRYQIYHAVDLLKQVEHNLKLEKRYDLLYPYFRWLYTKYSQGKLNDIENVLTKILPALYSFHRLKIGNKLRDSERDIDKVKDGKALLSLIRKYAGQELSRSQVGEELIKTGKAERVYNDANVQVIIPKTKKAACYFGINTKWCTAARSDNEFKNYTKDGKLYYVLFKKENTRYAIHIEKPKMKELIDNPSAGEMEIFDQTDKSINSKTFVEKYPIIGRIFKHRFEFNQPNKQDIAAVMRILAVKPDYITKIRRPTLEMKKQALKHSSSGRIYSDMEKGDKDLQEFILGSKGLAYAKVYIIYRELDGKLPQRWRPKILKENTEIIQYLRNVTFADWKIILDNNISMIRYNDGDNKQVPKKAILYAAERAETINDVHSILAIGKKIPEKYLWKFINIHPTTITRMRKVTPDMWRFAISWYPKLYKYLRDHNYSYKLPKELIKELKQLAKSTKVYRKEQLKKFRVYHVRPKKQPHMMNWAQLQKAVKSD